jgi:PAS domain S-box-containing protein
MAALPPANEQERLQALQQLEILDTPPEAAFDRITRLASQLFKVPIALVSLVDRDRQWFKSCYGLDTRQTDRQISFCAHAILADEVFVVSDATQDARFTDNPLVTGETAIRFYAGAPLKSRDGFNLGSLCILDTVPREFSEQQLAGLTDMAALVVDELELRRAARSLQDEIAERRRNEERLRLLEMVVVNANDAIVITEAEPIDEPGPRILYVNKAFTRMSGHSLEDVIGKTPRILQGPDTDRAARAKIRAALEKWRPVMVELVNYRNDGMPFWVELSIVPVANEKGWFTHWVSIQRDMTERKRADEAIRAAEERYRLLAENSLDLIGLLDLQGTVIYASPSHYHVLGYGETELESHSIFNVIHADDTARAGAAVGALMNSGQSQKVELRLARKSGEWLEVEAILSLVPSDGDNEKRILLSARDITARKQVEGRLQAAKAEAERANLAKSEFLSRMSHELRTPMNAILGFAQLLEMDELNTEQHQGIEQILKGGRHLLELINEVLDIARIEARQLSVSPEPVSVAEVALETLDLVRPLAAERGIRFENSISPTGCHVTADRQRLKQVMLNLLSNAVKYNREGGMVRLSCKPVADGKARFEVSDTGTGIAPQNIDKLFMPFERLNAEGSGIEGTGIGLSISQRLVELMSGDIGVQSIENQGSTFWVELPQAEDLLEIFERTENAAPIADETFADGAARTILYIEDNLSNLRLIERILVRHAQTRLLSAMDGRRGLEMAREHRPDLILLDLHLPDIQGDEVLQRLRAETGTREIPVVILSADATQRQIDRLYAAGAVGYLTKPLDVGRFLHVVEETLQKGTR